MPKKKIEIGLNGKDSKRHKQQEMWVAGTPTRSTK